MYGSEMIIYDKQKVTMSCNGKVRLSGKPKLIRSHPCKAGFVSCVVLLPSNVTLCFRISIDIANKQNFYTV